MPYVVIDTEGNGLFQYKNEDGSPKPSDDPGQPRLAELAMVFCDDDMVPTGQTFQRYIQPDGWEMEPGATAVNGLTTEFLHEHGVPVVRALEMYTQAIHEGHIVVCCNAQHDLRQIRAELRRAGMPDLFHETPNICIMRSAMPLKIKKLNGKGGFPGLVDLAAHFGVDMPARHTAMGDASVTTVIAGNLHRSGNLKPPAVHLAKGHPSRNEGEA